jgi:glycosyltransferase involved in cell wall biosynthesis
MMGGLKVSVVIPTCNRKEILHKCLVALANQTISGEEYEVIVVDDGSGDRSAEAAREFLGKNFGRWQVLEGPNRGPAHARNSGILVSSAPLILLLGDDMIGAPDLLEEHLSWHQEHPGEEVAVLGFVAWHPELPKTPIMNWFEKKDKPFRYGRIRHGDKIDFWYFFSCNLSFKRRFVSGHSLFDTDFPFAAFEDIEFGYRLQKRGLQILHNRKAVTYHYHPMTLESYCRRMERVGESTAIFYRKVPELDPHWARRKTPRPGLSHILVVRAYRFLERILPPATRLLRWKYFKTRAHLALLNGLKKGRSQQLKQTA